MVSAKRDRKVQDLSTQNHHNSRLPIALQCTHVLRWTRPVTAAGVRSERLSKVHCDCWKILRSLAELGCALAALYGFMRVEVEGASLTPLTPCFLRSNQNSPCSNPGFSHFHLLSMSMPSPES